MGNLSKIQALRNEAGVFILTTLLVEKLDELVYESAVKRGLKFHSKQLIKEIEKFSSNVNTGPQLNDLVQTVSTLLDDALTVKENS